MIYQLKEPQSSESSCSSPSKKKQVENLEPWIGKACLQQTKVVTSYLALLGGVAIQGLWCLCCSCSILQAPSLEPTRNSRFRYTDIGSRMFQVYRSFPTRKNDQNVPLKSLWRLTNSLWWVLQWKITRNRTYSIRTTCHTTITLGQNGY